MVQMKDKWGDIVEISQPEIQRALNSGYSYVSQPTAPTPTPTPTSSPDTISNFNVQGGSFKGTQQQYTDYVATHPQTANKFSGADNGGQMKVYGPDVEAAKAAGYTILYGSDMGSSWPSATITKAPVTTPQAPPNARDLISSTPKAGYIKGYDTNNGYAEVYVPKEKYIPGVALKLKEMTTGSLAPTSSIKIPAPALDNTVVDASMSGVGEVSKTYEDYLKQFTLPETKTEKTAQSLYDKMAALTGDMGNKEADQLNAEKAAGIQEMQTDLTNIVAQIKSKNAEYLAFKAAQEGRPITLSSISGSIEEKKAQIASETLLLQAQGDIIQGRLTSAQANVDRAIEVKYSVKENLYKTYAAQLEALKPMLSKEEKERGLAMEQWNNDRQKALAEKKTEEKNIQGVMMDAVKAGIKDANVLGAISRAKSFNEAMQLLGKYMPDENVIKLMTKYSDAGITNKDTLATAQAKLKNSRIYQDQVRAPARGGGGGKSSGGGIKPILNPEIDALAKAYLRGETLGSIGASKKAQVLQRAEELQKEKAVQDRPKTVEAVNNIIQQAREEGYGDQEIIKSFVEDFGFSEESAYRMITPLVTVK